MIRILKALLLGGTVKIARKEAKKAQKLARKSMKRAKKAVFFTVLYFSVGAVIGGLAVYKLKKN